jgi:hypothetical protein
MIANTTAMNLSFIWCSGKGLIRIKEKRIESLEDLGK